MRYLDTDVRRLLKAGLSTGLLMIPLLTAADRASPIEPSPITELNFELGPRGHVLTPVTIDGTETGTFAVDTGAASNVLHPRFADQAGIETLPETAIEVHGAHAKTSAIPVQLDSLAFGDVVATDVSAMVIDLSHVEGPDMRLDGLVGAPLLRDYDLKLDFERRTLALYPPHSVGSLAKAKGIGSNGIRLVHGSLIYMEIVFDGVTITAVLDTGSGRSAINTAAAEALDITLPSMPASHGAEQAPTIHRPIAAIPGMTIQLEAATLTSEAAVGIVDMPVFASLGLADEPAMILGTNFLVDRTLAVDYSNSKLYLLD